MCAKKRAQNREHDGKKRTRGEGKHQALMVLSRSLRSSILYIPTSGSLCLNVLSVSCVSVNCVVVVDRKTIGPFEREPFVVVAFEGIEYDIEWADGRFSSELMPRPMRTIISENYAEAKKGKENNKVSILIREKWSGDYVRRCPIGSGVRGKEEKSEHADISRINRVLRPATYNYGRRLYRAILLAEIKERKGQNGLTTSKKMLKRSDLVV